MKTEKFFVSLFMLNIILIIILIFSLKNDMMLAAFEDIFYSKKKDSTFMSFPPEMMSQYGFVNESPEVFKAGMDEIFAKTHIKHSALEHLDSVPILDRARLIVRMYSSMGSGICSDDVSLPDRVNRARKKEGCPKDYAMIFSALARYAGIQNRIVKNAAVYGVEIFDGKKWIFIDPYFAVTAYDKEGNSLSFFDLNRKKTESENIRLDFFGGHNHCMFGKNTSEMPYYKNNGLFGSAYVLMGDNVFSIALKESSVPLKPKFVHTFAPYRSVKPHWIYSSVGYDSTEHLKKVLSAGIVIWVLLFLASDIIFPIYFIMSKFRTVRKS